jgi:phospholipid-translocating ATPase
MAVLQFGEESDSNVSKPVRRMRWATQRHAGAGGTQKRRSIIDRIHKRMGSRDEKRKSSASSLPNGASATLNEDHVADPELRRIYFNIPIPKETEDEDGVLKTNYVRNKIRTAKYTPLSFIPKNLWFQFHNIANNYFLFIIILSVGSPTRYPWY